VPAPERKMRKKELKMAKSADVRAETAPEWASAR